MITKMQAVDAIYKHYEEAAWETAYHLAGTFAEVDGKVEDLDNNREVIFEALELVLNKIEELMQ